MVYERRFGMQISWEWYRVFYYAARYGNFSRAAEVMLSDQPNVTRTVRNLEAALGCQLFVRSNRGCTLTPEGAKLFSAVEAAHERIEDGEYELSRDRSLEAGVITVGASETALHELLIDAIRRFHSHYPGIRVRIFNHSTPQAVAALHDGLVDLAVVSTPTAVRPPITERGLSVFRECAVAGAQLSDLRGRTLSLSELSQYPLIMLGRGTMTYEFYTELFSRSGVELRADIEAATTDQVLPMVAAGLGIGFLPVSFAQPGIASGEVFELKLSFTIPERRICLLKRSDMPLSIAARELEKQLVGDSGQLRNV